MANNFRIIYLYIVCLITLTMIIGGIVSTVNNITSYFYPDSYLFFEEDNGYVTKYEKENQYELIEKNEIRKQNYKNEKIKNVVVSVVVIIVGTIMYKYHWNTIEKERIK